MLCRFYAGEKLVCGFDSSDVAELKGVYVVYGLCIRWLMYGGLRIVGL
jgi:hypothetical protein